MYLILLNVFNFFSEAELTQAATVMHLTITIIYSSKPDSNGVGKVSQLALLYMNHYL